MSKKNSNEPIQEKNSNLEAEPVYFVPTFYRYPCPLVDDRQEDLTFQPVNPEEEPTLKNINFTQAYLRTQIGKKVKIDFLIGTNLFIDKEGILLEVGVSYVVIRETTSNAKVMCDFYSIRFVTIFE
ncbi:MAG: hypothetical protein JG776_587 [Caloramator sp.]|uniref:hypothetical protein n=1 Tax=Caloramator sp. TaxID=1871330 RepID=UPI001D7B607D|nr:hypothetical protein [Caloramator sp.]MBZ4662905.1 hypothetical protein [Caloramator sp.]